jgi:hypothetical protein
VHEGPFGIAVTALSQAFVPTEANAPDGWAQLSERMRREDVKLRVSRAFGQYALMKERLGLALVAVLLLALTSCAPGPNVQQGVAAQGGEIAGFWLGLWHGIIAPITFVISLFSDNVNVNGNWYNFGFVLGASIVFGGGPGAGARRRKRR